MDYSAYGVLGYATSKKKLDRHREIQKRDSISRWKKAAKRCPTCDELASYEKRRHVYCSQSCAAVANNKRRYPVSKRRERFGSCRACGESLGRSAAKFCSQKCQHQWHYEEYIKRWLAGEEDGVVSGGLEVSNHIHRWVRETRGEKCEYCSWAERNPTSGTIPLHLDHVDGDSLNNRPNNLRLLCPNDHSLTPTFGNLNKGNGRVARYRKRSA